MGRRFAESKPEDLPKAQIIAELSGEKPEMYNRLSAGGCLHFPLFYYSKAHSSKTYCKPFQNEE
jgi:hypothetical protein